MIYRIRHVQLNDDGRVCWEAPQRKEYRSPCRNLLGQIITRTIRGEERFYRVEAAKLEKEEILK